jgi:aminoglycoside phosphotransferase (APT) family kinase protein
VFLRALGAPDDGAVCVPLTGGADALLWRVSWPGYHARPDAVLRVLRSEQAPVAAREAAAMEAAGAAGVPVPAVLTRGEAEGRPALLLSYASGPTALERLTAAPERGEQVGALLGRTLAALHLRAVVPGELAGDPDGWIDLAGPEAEPVKARLRSLPRRGDALLHLDFHPSNVVLAPDGGDVAAVLDWTNCRAGDPRADVARTLVMLDAAPAPAGIFPAGREESVRAALVRSFRDGYESSAGPLPPAAEMAPFFAWAAAWTLADLSPRTAPGGPLRPEQLDPLRRLYAYWRGA